jgi:hypothetical protein
MFRRQPARAWCLAICAAIAQLLAPAPLRAESVFALAGVSDATNAPENSYGWQLGFSEPLSASTSASFSWLNEGHISGHHRDGAAAQLWYVAPRWLDRIRFSVGAGPYFYFDTQQSDSALGYSNVHSAAALVSAALETELTRAWFIRMSLNAVYAPGDLNTVGFMVGAGYHLGRSQRAGAAGAGSDAGGPYARQQIELFGGEMIYNELSSHADHALGLEYRLALLPWAAWSATWFYNPGDASAQRNQIATQLWLVDALQNGKLEFSVGLGVYTPLGAAAAPAAAPGNFSGMSGLRVQWNCSRHGSVALAWYRSFTNDDDDRDIITLGYGFRFGATAL